MSGARFCGQCGSTDIRFSLGDCVRCGKSLDGEQNPASRSEGMFHQVCWSQRKKEMTACAS